jgi:hypothetical protein
MKHGINAAVAASLALLATSALADDEIARPNYKFAELDYVYAVVQPESDNLSAQQNNDDYYVPEGAKARGSWTFFDEELLVRGSYYTGSGEYKSTYDVDSSSLQASVGWLPPTEDTTGIDLSLDYRADNFELDKPNKIDEDIDGLGLSVGLRTTPFKDVEFGARLGWYEGDYDGAIGASLNAAYNFGENWGVNLFWEQIKADSISGELSSYEVNQYGVGGRYYF